MSGMVLLLGSSAIFFIAYITYGSWLSKKWGIDPARKTPAHTQRDGVDYVPTKPIVLLGHHFSSIAGAGPIVGPITAAVFGWVPVVLWVLIGSIFFGGVQDYGSLVASLRHKGQTIGEIIDATIGRRGKFLFSIFAWLTLIVVLAAFANIVAATFVASPQSARRRCCSSCWRSSSGWRSTEAARRSASAACLGFWRSSAVCIWGISSRSR